MYYNIIENSRLTNLKNLVKGAKWKLKEIYI